MMSCLPGKSVKLLHFWIKPRVLSHFIIRIVRYSGETPLASRAAGLGT